MGSWGQRNGGGLCWKMRSAGLRNGFSCGSLVFMLCSEVQDQRPKRLSLGLRVFCFLVEHFGQLDGIKVCLFVCHICSSFTFLLVFGLHALLLSV